MNNDITLSEIRMFWPVTQISPPSVVYHVAARENVRSIIDGNAVRCASDPGTYFFRKPDHAVFYYDAVERLKDQVRGGTQWLHGPEGLCILEVIPKRKEPRRWFQLEPIGLRIDLNSRYSIALEEMQLFHYGDLTFTRPPRIISFADMYFNENKYGTAHNSCLDFDLISGLSKNYIKAEYPYEQDSQ